MNYIFWAFLFNAFANIVSLFLPRLFNINIAFLLSLVVFGLILKGISVLNQHQRNFINAKTLAIILMATACLSGLVSNVGNTVMDVPLSILFMSSGILGIIMEYQIIKGIQSYSKVLTNGQETIRLMRYWKTNLISTIIFSVALMIAIFAVVFAVMFTIGPSMITEVTDLLFIDLERYIEALSPNAPILIFLLLVLSVTLLIIVITRILWIIALYTIQEDHQQTSKRSSILSVVE